jgi:hypothetical protein
MITLTALVALLGLGWGIQHLCKRVVAAARTVSVADPITVMAPTKS